MASGKWLSQDKLDQMLDSLAAGYAAEDSATASR